MRSFAPRLSKFSSPRTYRTVARERLFERLDSWHDRACIWVCAPPGAGKTTLVSSWLEARDRASFWYQIDSGDDDPASFFAYLIEMARGACGNRARGLPYLTPDHLRDLPAFSRRFFRHFFAVMSPAVLVFDNHHEAMGSVIDPILRELVAGIPASFQLVMISRLDVPATLMRCVSTGHLMRMGWEEVRLTESEAANLISMHDAKSSPNAAHLHAMTDGWAAGIVLLTNARSSRPASPGKGSGALPEAVFAYFTEELFQHAAIPDQELLLQTCCFRQFTRAMADRLTGHADVSTLLDSLYHRHYFTERRFVVEYEYRYHDLFRTYLRERAPRHLGKDRWNDVLARAAVILCDSNEFGQAADLLIEAHAWSALCALILNQAERMLARGQWQTLRQWLVALPDAALNSDPWLLFWQGMARVGEDPSGARVILEQAHARFTSMRDMKGRMRACTSIIDIYYQEWNTVDSLDAWIRELHELLSAQASRTSIDELDAAKSLATALLYRHLTHTFLPTLVEEIRASWRREKEVNKRLLCVSLLFDYFSLMGDFDTVHDIVEQSAADGSSDEALPVNAFLWWRWVGLLAYREGRFDEACKRLSKSIDIGLRHGLTDQAFVAQLALAMAEASAGRLVRAADLLVEMRSTLDPTQHMHAVGYRYMELWLAAANEDLEKAQRIWETFSRMPVVGVPVNSAYNLPVIWLLCNTGQIGEALERVERWFSQLDGMRSPLLRFNLLCMKAYAQIKAGDSQSPDTLRQFLRLGATHRYATTLTWLPGVIADLCAHALDHDVESEYVRWLIRERRIPAPPSARRWPRPIEIRTLGQFQILLDGRRLEFAHKAPKKPLALLKALVAAGPRGLSKERAESWLWPELDGDASADAMTSALLRLRRLLRRKEAVRLSEGVLTLDEQSVWVDAFWFERLTHNPEDCHRAVDAYGGPFLPTDDNEHWALTVRDRLKTRFVTAAQQTAQALQDGGRPREAIACLRRAIIIEPLADTLYLDLMRAYVRDERFVEAAGVFQQLRKTYCTLGESPPGLPSDLQRSLHYTVQGQGQTR